MSICSRFVIQSFLPEKTTILLKNTWFPTSTQIRTFHPVRKKACSFLFVDREGQVWRRLRVSDRSLELRRLGNQDSQASTSHERSHPHQAGRLSSPSTGAPDALHSLHEAILTSAHLAPSTQWCPTVEDRKLWETEDGGRWYEDKSDKAIMILPGFVAWNSFCSIKALYSWAEWTRSTQLTYGDATSRMAVGQTPEPQTRVFICVHY